MQEPLGRVYLQAQPLQYQGLPMFCSWCECYMCNSQTDRQSYFDDTNLCVFFLAQRECDPDLCLSVSHAHDTERHRRAEYKTRCCPFRRLLFDSHGINTAVLCVAIVWSLPTPRRSPGTCDDASFGLLSSHASLLLASVMQ